MIIKTETTITFKYPEERDVEIAFSHDNDMSEWKQNIYGDGLVSYTTTKKVNVEWGENKIG